MLVGRVDAGVMGGGMCAFWAVDPGAPHVASVEEVPLCFVFAGQVDNVRPGFATSSRSGVGVGIVGAA